jgi:hypothetical protein
MDMDGQDKKLQGNVLQPLGSSIVLFFFFSFSHIQTFFYTIIKLLP